MMRGVGTRVTVLGLLTGVPFVGESLAFFLHLGWFQSFGGFRVLG